MTKRVPQPTEPERRELIRSAILRDKRAGYFIYDTPREPAPPILARPWPNGCFAQTFRDWAEQVADSMCAVP